MSSPRPATAPDRHGRIDLVAAVLLALVAASGWLASATLRHPLERLTGDEGTYYAMAASLARDGDLRFAAPDRELAAKQPGQGLGLILQQTDRGIFYSKPILYALWGAPFVALLGANGLVAANAVALGGALLLGLAFLRRLARRGHAALVLVSFAGAGALAGQLVWRMTESLQVALALSGLALCFGRLRSAPEGEPGRLSRWLDSPSAPWVGAALLGALASLRDPNLLIAALPPLVALLFGEWRRALAFGMVVAAAFGILLVLTGEIGGSTNPYRALRSSFDAVSGYPVEGEPPHPNFHDYTATQSLTVRPQFEPRRTAVAGLTFLIGRHTGMLVYYPCLLALLPLALRRPDRLTFALLGTAGALALFYVVWMPSNYFGGEAFLSNRYYLVALPLFLLAPTRLPGRLALAVAWAVAALVGGSALLSITRSAAPDSASQSHAYAGIFRALPYETTGAPVGGRSDRYWSGDFLRFVDPFAEVGSGSFTLTNGSPPAEVVLATYWDGDHPRLLAVAEGGPAELVLSDWRGRHRYRLPHSPGGGIARGILTLDPARPWRRHSFWWGDLAAIYNVRALRLAVNATSREPARVRLRYLGRGDELDRQAAAELLEGELPREAPAGGSTRLRLRVRNSGRTIWSSHAALPTRLAFRIDELDGAPILEGRADLLQEVAPGGELTQELEIAWPSRPGPCRVTVDLLREDLAWFGEATGRPLLTGEVTLTD